LKIYAALNEYITLHTKQKFKVISHMSHHRNSNSFINFKFDSSNDNNPAYNYLNINILYYGASEFFRQIIATNALNYMPCPTG